MEWWQISVVLCSYGFFKEFRPSEPFISKYLIMFKNFTIEQVNEEIFPVGTYCYLALLIVIFLLTDFFKYKPILVVGSFSGIITWSLLTWGTTIKEMQVVEFFYGLFLASEVAYFTYMYAKVDKKHYQKITSHTRAAVLIGRAIAGLSSQILVSLNINYLELNYFSIFGVALTVPIAFILPPVAQSIYFHCKETEVCSQENVIGLSSIEEKVWEKKENKSGSHKFNSHQWKVAFWRLFTDFKTAYTNAYVVRWCIWWALATCGYLQAISYCQLLWEEIIENDNAILYNGIVEFIYAVSGAAVAFGVGFLKIQWSIWGDFFLGFLTVIQGSFLFYSAYLNNLYVAYLVFILYRDFYEAAITIATCEVAKLISQDSYALIFGINTFAALSIQTVLTVIVLETLHINIRPQYQIYGAYHVTIGAVFLLFGIMRLVLKRREIT